MNFACSQQRRPSPASRGEPRASWPRWSAAICACSALFVGDASAGVAEPKLMTVALPVTIVSTLPAALVPMDVEVDFAAVARKAGLPGVFDPNTVEVDESHDGRATASCAQSACGVWRSCACAVAGDESRGDEV